jgi:phosphoribosyl-AMP cyclohydrolase
MTDASKTSPPLDAGETIEKTLRFLPKLGPDGLIPAIVTDAKSGNVLMFAHMNEEALRATIASGVAHFWSRSRAKLWKKGEESGNIHNVREVRTDCDQDVLWLFVDVAGNGFACHTGETSCFYRRVISDDAAHGMVLETATLPRPVGRG